MTHDNRPRTRAVIADYLARPAFDRAAYVRDMVAAHAEDCRVSDAPHDSAPARAFGPDEYGAPEFGLWGRG